MKVATITCHNVYNHGASLQAYALAAYLQSLGHEVEIINYRPGFDSGSSFMWDVPARYDKAFVRWLYRMAKLPYRFRERSRRHEFDDFTARYLPVGKTLYGSWEQLRSNPPQADVYIAGSDQIWNTEFRNGTDPAFYLDFGAGEVRRLSYAASFATVSLRPGTEDFVKQHLSRLDAISVREQSALRILDNIGYQGVVVVDPVFLLSREQWDAVASTEGQGEDYILVYDFERGGPIADVAKRLSRLLHCKIFSIGFEGKPYADKNFVTYGPASFVSLIANSRCVVSNSFHGSAFSIIYGKDFFVVNRSDGLNVRMQDLLSHYGIKDRLISPSVSDNELLSHIDYSQPNRTLKDDILLSKNFIDKSLMAL